MRSIAEGRTREGARVSRLRKSSARLYALCGKQIQPEEIKKPHRDETFCYLLKFGFWKNHREHRGHREKSNSLRTAFGDTGFAACFRRSYSAVMAPPSALALGSEWHGDFAGRSDSAPAASHDRVSRACIITILRSSSISRKDLSIMLEPRLFCDRPYLMPNSLYTSS